MNSLPDFGSIRVLCIGDLMIDRFVQGVVDRISPESPVPVVRFQAEQVVPGGGGNVARNVVSLGASCTVVGVLGCDAAGDELSDLMSAEKRTTLRAIRQLGRPTTQKTRFIAQGQHLLRVDCEVTGELDSDVVAALKTIIAEEVEQHDVVILSDYAKGVLSDEIARWAVAEAARVHRPVVADPKTTWLERFAGATVITPNIAEAAAATGIHATDDANATLAVERITSRLGVSGVLLTRADQGMTLRTAEGETTHIAAAARAVFDVVGAGDTVAATIGLCLGAGLDLQRSARIANTAAGLVVAKRGTATVNRGELLEELTRGQSTQFAGAVKILDAVAARAQREAWRDAGLTVGFTNGCFDLLHAGHVQLLQFARSCCDRLVVGLNDDASIGRLKGDTRPITPARDRAELLAALAAVDAVVLFAEDTPFELIAAIRPEVLVKGADYEVDRIVGADLVLGEGGRVERFDLIAGRSTTSIVERVLAGRQMA